MTAEEIKKDEIAALVWEIQSAVFSVKGPAKVFDDNVKAVRELIDAARKEGFEAAREMGQGSILVEANRPPMAATFCKILKYPTLKSYLDSLKEKGK